MQFNFIAPHQLYFGAGTFSNLAHLSRACGKTFLILIGAGSFKKTQSYHDLIAQFSQHGLTHHIEPVEKEPSVDMVDTIVQRYQDTGIEGVIGIGGGSVLDAGKAVSAMLDKNQSVIHYLEGVGDLTHDGTKKPFIAVPTTSGTGSEATKNAVISKIGENGFKKSLRHNNFIPNIALVDPQLTVNCPLQVTAACGMDAFTQLLEAFVSTKANPMTDSLATGALSALNDTLPKVMLYPSDIDLRSRLSYASYISGLVLANAGLGVVHGFAGVIGGFFDIPHGVICGSLLAPVTRENIETLIASDPDHIAIEKYGQVASLLSPAYHKKDPVSDAIYLCTLLDEWTATLEIPKLSELGVSPKNFDIIIEQTGQKNNPCKLPKKALHKILAAAG